VIRHLLKGTPVVASSVPVQDDRAIDAGSELRVSLGDLIRAARTGRFTIDELARRSGVSSGRISQIERGLANPSFETLWKLATALQIQMGTFFQGPAAEERMVVRKDEGKRLVLPHDDLVYELLTPDLQRSLEVFRFHVPPAFDNSRRPITHQGEECIHILEGSLEVTVGEQTFLLGEGDSITYEAVLPHFVRNPGKATAVAIAAVTPPSF
jgi:transcriptional regulator with XRE-family HTH domain